MKRFVRTVGAGLLAVVGACGAADAQAMTPLKGVIRSTTDAFAVRVFPTNTYEDRIRVEIHVYDQDFYEIPAEISSRNFTLAGGASRQVTVVVPFDGRPERRVRICTESIPFPSQATKIETQVCGKFVGRRLAP